MFLEQVSRFNKDTESLFDGFRDAICNPGGLSGGSNYHQELHPSIRRKLGMPALTYRVDLPGYFYTAYDYPHGFEDDPGIKGFVFDNFHHLEVVADKINQNGIPTFTERLHLAYLYLVPEFLPRAFICYCSIDERGKTKQVFQSKALVPGNAMLRRLLV